MIKKHLQRSFVALTLVAVSATASFAGAWTAKQGAYYDKLAYNYYYSHETFNTTGSRGATPNNGKFIDHNVSNYFEYGLLDNLTVVNAISYKWLENEDNTLRTKGYGLADVDLGARYKLLDSDRFGIVSSQLLVKIPGAYSKNDALPLGNGQYDTELRLLYGRSLYPLIPGYGNVEIGYRWRAEAPSDEIRFLVECGVDLSKDFYTRAKLDGTVSVNNGIKLDTNGNPTSSNNFDLGKLDLTVGYKAAPNWGIEASYVPSLYGQNTAAGATYSLALYFKTP